MALINLAALKRQVDDLAERVAALESVVSGDEQGIESLKALTALLAAGTDAGGHAYLSVSLPEDGTFSVFQGKTLRHAVDSAGNVGLFGNQVTIQDAAGKGGGLTINPGGVLLTPPGHQCLIWMHPDGRVSIFGVLENEDDSAVVSEAAGRAGLSPPEGE